MENANSCDISNEKQCHSSSNPQLKSTSKRSYINTSFPHQSTENKKIGDSFLKQGELRLLHGDSSGIQFFDLAIQLDPKNDKLYYDQGLSLLEFGSEKGNEKKLLLAAKRFKIATSLNPSFFDAYLSWGHSLFLLGKTYHEHHYYLEAEAKYKKALAISKGQPPDVLADLYWNYGSVWAAIAKHSNEPADMRLALEAYSKAQEQHEDLSTDFWHDYGEVCLDLGVKVNDLRFFVKAINCYKNAVSISISSYESWFHLASALKDLYHFTHDEDHFTQANECFSTAAQLNSKDDQLWLNWAIILNTSGRQIKDAKRIRASIEKCQKAYSINPNHPLITAIWSEALSMLGLLNDDVNLIYEAQNKISSIIDVVTDLPDLYHSHGFCLYCLGKYFNDLDFFYQAIEKNQEGLNIDRTCHKLWHALGYTYCSLGLLEDNNKTFERAHKFFQKAIALHGSSTYYFDYGFSLLKYGEILNDQKTLELSKYHFEQALNLQKNAVYLHPDWLFHYGVCLDLLGEFTDDRNHFTKALDILNHVLMVDPDYPEIHYYLALTFGHYAQLTTEIDSFYRSIHHYRLAHKKDEENDQIILDWALTLIALGDELENPYDKNQYFREAEFKLTQAAKLGNTHAFYHIACLYSLLNQTDKAMHFIRKADEFDSLPSPQELLEDDWLENLRITPSFQKFLSHLESQSNIED